MFLRNEVPPFLEAYETVRILPTGDGIRLAGNAATPHSYPAAPVGGSRTSAELMSAMSARAICERYTHQQRSTPARATLDVTCTETLVLPRSDRWREALSMALQGSWCHPLFHTGHLPLTALGALRAEARTLHRQLVPIWRRGTRHGRVLSLDATLGAGLSLHDLVAADVDLLARMAGGVFADERLNRVLHALTPDEQQVVHAYAKGEGTTWTEAAAYTGAADPVAFGERVRRKVKRLAAEQARRTALRSGGPATP